MSINRLHLLRRRQFEAFVFIKILVVIGFSNSITIKGNELLPGARLRSDLLTNYHTVVRPVRDHNTVTKVTYKAWLYELVAIDPKAQTINMVLFQALEWDDELLRWDPQNYSGLDSVRFDRDEIWTPDILPFNEVGGFDDAQYDSIIPIEINNEGYAWWTRPVDYETTCNLDVTNFPFDTQHCEVIVGSWHYQQHEVQMACGNCRCNAKTCSMEVSCDSPYLRDSLWSLESKKCLQLPSNETRGIHSLVHISVTFKRLSTFYVQNLIVPHTLILFMSTLIFFIPGEAGEKMGYGVMVTLTIVVNLSIVADFLPQSSTSYPKLYQFYICSIVISGLSLVLSTISINFAYPAESKKAEEYETTRDVSEDGNRTSALRFGDIGSNALAQSENQDQIETRHSSSSRQNVVSAQNGVPLNPRWTSLKRWIIYHWKHTMTRRKIDMAIGVVYFIVVLMYTICFFSSLK